MGDIAMASNKVIGLTGTLLNGYADGLFYILYRTMPELMKKEGFDYSDESLFQRTYGVVKSTSEHQVNSIGRTVKIKSGQEKRLPGVSPLVFTKFLLENAVFVSISDMSDNLPNYTEYPLPVIMDDELKTEYDKLEQSLKAQCNSFDKGKKILGSYLQTMSTYPDMPYDCIPILHPDTANILYTPTELSKGLRNKENALIDLVKRKKEEGEKVLIYYEWTNKTDVASKLIKALEDEGIKAVDLTSKVKAKDREKWIEKQSSLDIDVLMCNPNLVKTGLDLIDFTTIIFYQIGYNIFTMRQASRRSWRLSQKKDVEVYFMFYRDTIQEKAISLMASKMQASMALEGKFSEEGLRAMADNEDLLSQIANSVVEGIKDTVDVKVFTSTKNNSDTSKVIIKNNKNRKTLQELLVNTIDRYNLSYLSNIYNKKNNKSNKAIKSVFNNDINIVDLYKSVV